MTYLERLHELTNEKRFSVDTAEKIISGYCTEAEVNRVEYLYDKLNDILQDMEVDSDSVDEYHSFQYITGDFKDFLDFIIEEKITPKEFELMNL